jgi:hypothetical protein
MTGGLALAAGDLASPILRGVYLSTEDGEPPQHPLQAAAALSLMRLPRVEGLVECQRLS